MRKKKKRIENKKNQLIFRPIKSILCEAKVTTATLKSRNYLDRMRTMLGSWTMSELRAS